MNRQKIQQLEQKIQEHKANVNYAEFKRKRSLYQDHFFDAEKHEIERDEEQEIVDKLTEELSSLQKKHPKNGSNYIQCIDCNTIVHQRRLRLHVCGTSPITQYNKRLTL